MTQEQEKRIAIAKACGWKKTKNKHGQIVILNNHGHELWDYDDRGNSYGPAADWDSQITLDKLPNYLNVKVVGNFF